MKRILMKICLLFLFGTLAYSQPTITIGSPTAYTGHLVTVPLTVTNFSGIGSFQFKIDIGNSALLAAVNALTLTALPINVQGLSNVSTNSIASANSTDEIIILWYSPDGTTTASYPDGTVLFNLTFYVDPSAVGSRNLIWNQILISDINGATLSPVGVPGTLTFTATPTPSVTNTSVTTGPDNIAFIPVTVTNVNSYAGFDIRISFPADFTIDITPFTDGIMGLPSVVTTTGSFVTNTVTNLGITTVIMLWAYDGTMANTLTVGPGGSGALCTLKVTYTGVDAGIFAFTFNSVPKFTTIGGSEVNGSGIAGNVSVPIRLNTKTFLEGPYSGGVMNTLLRSNGYLPLSQPYSGAPYNYTGLEVVASIPANVVDWVLVELRSGTAAGTLVARRAGFILNNGNLVDLDGVSNLQFPALTTNASYYVVVRHRNHLAAMSVTNPLLKNTSSLYDFSTIGQSYGTNGMKSLGGGVYGMYAGDANSSGIVTVSDISAYISLLNQTGYLNPDINMSGIITVSDFNMTIPNFNISNQVPN